MELRAENLDRFVALFEGTFYVDKEMIAKEIPRSGMFNLIHNEYLVKIDFIIRKQTAFDDAAFGRRRKATIDQTPMWLISPEDLILAKLRWARDSHSEMQLKDVKNLLETVEDLDWKYVDGWINRLDLAALYSEVKI